MKRRLRVEKTILLTIVLLGYLMSGLNAGNTVDRSIDIYNEIQTIGIIDSIHVKQFENAGVPILKMIGEAFNIKDLGEIRGCIAAGLVTSKHVEVAFNYMKGKHHEGVKYSGISLSAGYFKFTREFLLNNNFSIETAETDGYWLDVDHIKRTLNIEVVYYECFWKLGCEKEYLVLYYYDNQNNKMDYIIQVMV